MKRFLSLILCSSAIMLTLSSVVEARPPRYGSVNPGVHRRFLPRNPYYGRGDRRFYRNNYNSCYNCVAPTPYRRGYERGYYRGYREGRRNDYYNRDYYRRGRGRAGVTIYYEAYP